MTKYNLNNLLEYAEKNEGKLLSEKYINGTTKYNWVCKKGHLFSIEWGSCIRYNTWCKLCKHGVGLDVLIEYAENKGGKCLSEKYIHTDSKYKWECSNGHVFDKTFSSVRNNNWCGECKEEDKLQEMNDFVKEKHGEGSCCLSNEYFYNETMYEWKCNKNHIFKMTWSSITRKRGSWCHNCLYNTGIDVLQTFALNKGGKLISTEYNAILDSYEWECCKGHKFERKWQHVRKDDYWCKQCNDDVIFEEMKTYAIEHNGKLLSENYTQSGDVYKWTCENNHKWTRRWTNMKHEKSWCRKCNCWTLEDIKSVAESRNEKCIECISGNGIAGRYIWMCSEGHTFEVSGSIVYESKCVQCNKLSIEEMKQLAIDRGGECLSNVYINSRTKLKWKCCRGHEWYTIPKTITRGTWCKQCSDENKIKSNSEHRDEIDDIEKCPNGHILLFGKLKLKNDECGLCNLNKIRHNKLLIAIERCKEYLTNLGGKLISTSEEEILKICKTTTQNECSILILCKNNHTWETSIGRLSQGQWCTKCRYKSEGMSIDIIEEITNEKFIKQRPEWLKKMELDGYCEKMKLAIEYNGIQHSEYSKFFHGNDVKKFESQKARDLLKNELCVKNGVTLISVPFIYNMNNRNDMYDFIKSELVRYNIIIE